MPSLLPHLKRNIGRKRRKNYQVQMETFFTFIYITHERIGPLGFVHMHMIVGVGGKRWKSFFLKEIILCVFVLQVQQCVFGWGEIWFHYPGDENRMLLNTSSPDLLRSCHFLQCKNDIRDIVAPMSFWLADSSDSAYAADAADFLTFRLCRNTLS